MSIHNVVHELKNSSGTANTIDFRAGSTSNVTIKADVIASPDTVADDLTLDVTLLTLKDGATIRVPAAATTGFKVGATADKMAFFGATPIIEPVGAGQAATGPAAPAGGTGATAGAYDTAANRDLAIVLINETRTLVNQLRSDLVALGLIKGAA